MSLWTSGDVLKAKRLNRLALAARLGAPLYDVDGSDVIKLTAKPVDGTYVVTTETTHYTVGGGITHAIVHSLTLCNAEGSTNQASLHLVPSGGSRLVANQLCAGTLEALESLTIRGPWFTATSDTIRSISSGAVSGDLALRAEVSDLDLDPTGVTLIPNLSAALTTSFVTQYACPGSGVVHTNIVSITLCNTDSVARQAFVAVVPSGQSAAARYHVFNQTMEPGETVVIGSPEDPFVLEPGDFVQGKAATGSVVSWRVSPVEYATS